MLFIIKNLISQKIFFSFNKLMFLSGLVFFFSVFNILFVEISLAQSPPTITNDDNDIYYISEGMTPPKDIPKGTKVVTNLDEITSFCQKQYETNSVLIKVDNITGKIVLGSTIKLNGNITNTNEYPITNAEVLVKVINLSTNEVVQTFSATNNLLLLPNIGKTFTFEWKVPTIINSGNYQMNFFVRSHNKFDISGISSSYNISAGAVEFSIVDGKVTKESDTTKKPSTTNELPLSLLKLPVVMNYPLVEGKENTVFSCTYNIGRDATTTPNSKIVLTLKDDKGSIIHTYTKETASVGEHIAKSTFTPEENYETFSLEAELYKDGKVVDKTTINYDCNIMETCKENPVTNTINNLNPVKSISTNTIIAIISTILLIATGFYFFKRRGISSTTVVAILFVATSVLSFDVERVSAQTNYTASTHTGYGLGSGWPYITETGMMTGGGCDEWGCYDPYWVPNGITTNIGTHNRCVLTGYTYDGDSVGGCIVEGTVNGNWTVRGTDEGYRYAGYCYALCSNINPAGTPYGYGAACIALSTGKAGVIDSSGNCCTGTTWDVYGINNISCSAPVPPPACNLPWGGTTPHGTSVTAYQASSPNSPAACVSETRICSYGTLSGSYTSQSCNVTPPCNLPWGGVLYHGSTITAYQVSSTVSPTTCASVSQQRTCTNGVLSGSYNNQTCFDNPPVFSPPPATVAKCSNEPFTINWSSNNVTSCTPTWSSINCNFSPVTPGLVGFKNLALSSGSCDISLQCSGPGGNLTKTASVAIDDTKIWDGFSCVNEPSAPCPLPWGGFIPHNSSVRAYRYPLVESPTTCLGVSQVRTCTNGVLSGSSVYNEESCAVTPDISKIITGTITVPPSCQIAIGQSTCTVTASWVSAYFGSPRFYDNNTNTTLSTAPGGSQTVWVAYGGTTFKLDDTSKSINYDTKTVSASCITGSEWVPFTSKCETSPTATLTTNYSKVSYKGKAVLTSSSTNATACDINLPGPWPYNPGILYATTDTGEITSTSTYTFQCFASGKSSSLMSRTINVCAYGEPLYKNGVCNITPTVTNTLGDCNYAPNCPLTIIADDNDICVLNRDGVEVKTVSGNDTTVVPLNVTGSYLTKCYTIDDNSEVFEVRAPVSIDYSSTAPKPIVFIKASPSNISINGQTVLTWKVTYPNSVQVPSRPACTLTAKPVCPGGLCSASQLLASTTINNIILNDNTDANDPSGSRKITSTAINVIADTPENILSGNTHWEARGKKTFILNHSMDFMLRCEDGANEKKGVRVMVTSSTEG